MLHIFLIFGWIALIRAMATLTYDGNLCPDIACNTQNGLNRRTNNIFTRINPPPPPPPDGNPGKPIRIKLYGHNPITNKGTYTGEACVNPVKTQLIANNRRKNCPPKRCKTAETGLECDEFPFASSYEGGRGASSICLPAWQNNMAGGGNLNGFYTANNIGDKDAFMVTVVNLPSNCPSFGDETTTIKNMPSPDQKNCFYTPPTVS